MSSEFVFTSVVRPASASSAPVLAELQLVTKTPGLVTSSTKTRTVVLNASVLAERGSPSTAGWVSFDNGAEIKLSIFWRPGAGEDPDLPTPQSPPTFESGVASPPTRPNFFRRLTSGDGSSTSAASLYSPSASAVSLAISSIMFMPDNTFESSYKRPRLTITVHQARKLKSANLTGGSDPYVGLSVRGTRLKTKVVRSTVDPVWNETFVFGQVEDLEREDELQLVIKDWDQLGRNHDLGQVVFPLNAIPPGSASPHWYQVVPTPEMRMKSSARGEALGEIELTIECTSWDDDNSVAPIPLDLAQDAVTKPRLVLRLIQARGLPACDSNGKSDPYFVCQVAQERVKTKPRIKTLCPVYDCEFVFGAKSLLDVSDELKLTCMDSDLGPGTLFDDLIGELVLPLYSLPRQPSEPRWYALQSKDFTHAGEVQLAAHVELPPASVDIYKGKVWLYQLTVTVLEARGLSATDSKTRTADAYVKLECGSDAYKTKVVAKSLTPVWQEQFVFKQPAEGERTGLGRGDALSLRVKSQGTEIGQLSLNIAALADRMGYIDLQGKKITDWFDLGAPGLGEDAGAGDDDDAVEGSGGGDNDDDGGGGGDSVAGGVSSLRGMKMPGMALTRRSARPAAASPNSSPGPLPSEPTSPTSPASPDLSMVTTGLGQGHGQIRLRLHLQPCGETRSVIKKSVMVRLDAIEGVSDAEAVFATVSLGYDTLDSGEAIVYKHLPQVPALFHNTLVFDNCEWMLAEAVKWRTARAKADKFRRPFTLGPAPDALVVTIKDADTDRVVGEMRSTLHDVMQAPSMRFEAGKAAVRLSTDLAQFQGEMVPLLGHIHLALFQFKSYASTPVFKSNLRFVIRYGGKEATSRQYANDPNPRLQDEEAHFAVYNVFTPVEIEVLEDRVPIKGPRPSRLLSLLRASSSSPSAADPSAAGGGGGGPNAGGGGSEATTMTVSLGKITLSLYEMVEFETKTFFEVEAVTKLVEENAMKLPVKDEKGATAGTLWLSARYREYFAGVLSANPNPPTKQGKPFSFANFRHEVNRLVAAVSWLSDFGKHVGRILDWESTPTTVFVMSVFVIVCCLDWFSSRFLALFPFCMLIHMINRHRARANGDFLIPFEETDDADSLLEAEVRVAVLGASLPRAQGGKSYQCKLALVKDVSQPRSKLEIGWTRVDSNVVDGQANFVRSRAGYGINFSKAAKPSLQLWRMSATSDPVTSFDLRVTNPEPVNQRLLALTIKSAKGLLAADSNGLSDPFCHITVGGAVLHKTGVRPKTLSPVWDERFVLGGGKKPLLPGDVIVVIIFDSDGAMMTADKLGSVEINVSEIDMLFPRPSGGAEGVVFKVRPPPKESKSDCGSILIACEWVDVTEVKGLVEPPRSSPRLHLGNTPGRDLTKREDDAGEEEILPPDSWKKCSSQVHVDLYEMETHGGRIKSTLLGQVVVPIAALVVSDEQRPQPPREMTLQLGKRLDGSRKDLDIVQVVNGTVTVACQVHLPDPKAKERRLALAAAKKADKANALSKLRTMNQQLSKVQNTLFQLNNRLERTKNVFNWTHPRKTKIMFNLMLFLFVFFIVLPTRFVVLAVVLFFMTEHFRPLGTMGARFKHLVAQLPTDDDLKEVVKGEVMASKGMPITRKRKDGASSDRALAANKPDAHAKNRPSRQSSAEGVSRHSMSGAPGQQSSQRPSLAVLKQITPGDALTEGHMNVLINEGVSVSKLLRGSGSQKFARRYFILSFHGLHYWTDKDSSESKEPAGHIVLIESVRPCTEFEVASLVPGAEHLGGFFQVTHEGGNNVVFFCSSVQKRDKWVECIRSIVGGE